MNASRVNAAGIVSGVNTRKNAAEPLADLLHGLEDTFQNTSKASMRIPHGGFAK